MILRLPKKKKTAEVTAKPVLPRKVNIEMLWTYERLVDGLWEPVEKKNIKSGDIFVVFDENGKPAADGKAFLCLSELWYTSETKKWDIKAVPYSAHLFLGNYQKPKGAGDVEQED
jgi:hypothetical protein